MSSAEQDVQQIDALAGVRVVVVGLGASGRAAATVLHEVGARVTVAVPDAGEAEGADLPRGVDIVADADAERLAEKVGDRTPAVLVASPGVPPHNAVLTRALGSGAEVWSEIELAWRIDRAATQWLTLTGTNGKTTTVGMLASQLAAAGWHAPAVGNVGTPVSTTVLNARSGGRALDGLAVELSSFQLHFTHSVSPLASACLNFTDDHLDWHGTAQAYWDDKARVYQRSRVACVYNSADEKTLRMVEAAEVREGARAVGFTLQAPRVAELGLVESHLVDRAFIDNRQTHGQVVAELADLAHLAPGGGSGAVPPHVVSNALAAAAMARAAGLAPEHVAYGLRTYEGGAHRIQHVADVDGVSYVDDSKATNAHAASASLASVEPGRGVWIAGGLAKGARFEDLVSERVDRLRAVVVIGVDAEAMLEALARHAAHIPHVRIEPGEHEVMTAAVSAAARLAQPGDVVLLAPASASMDQFSSYAHRGEAFADAVRALARRG
ncbi:UDP-N-acetylmuramoyl-L-alanine--D-glutamate ligase [Pseudactinotalea suaedae]|uniref:UDP-N-acetylmuramoyl-L-alanine--D-glutamate ligase n=1 Tax=Pseudactinotalea suaedae TaxID=1524924 RepID=UPI001F4F7DD6|nr:UDP-N-acetylmuramoyl-L-alanine--D-glutamate ligase [Pseudactinotalea suaedae]